MQRNVIAEWRQVLDLIVGKVQVLQLAQSLQRREVLDPVLRQIERREVHALFEAGQIGDLHAEALDGGEIDHVGLDDRFVIIALVEDEGPHCLLQILVFENGRFRRGIGQRAGRP